MTLREHESLALHTTLKIGGEARFFTTAVTAEEVEEAIAFASERALPIAILGGGSNTLVRDEGFEGLVLEIAIPGIEFHDKGETVEVIAGAGVVWDQLVEEAAQRSLWGIENLAGIPGLVGGAVVQNIGAYGVELKDTFLFSEVLDGITHTRERYDLSHAEFGYRESVFKHSPHLVVLTLGLSLSKQRAPRLSYADLKKISRRLTTPGEIASAVREIRAGKFPQDEGTAGSFFKNPILKKSAVEKLLEQFPDLPTFPLTDNAIKIPLAWILDHVLSAKGYRKGKARLYEKQPLVIVADPGALSADVDALANEVAKKIQDATGISVEREVVTLAARKLSTHSR